MKCLLTLIFALLALTSSAQSPPGSTPYPFSADSSIWLRSEKLFGPLPAHATTIELLGPAPILSTSTGCVQVLAGTFSTLAFTNGAILMTNTAIRLSAVLPGWDGNQVYPTISLTSGSNEPNHTVKFSLRAGAIASGAGLSNPTFGAAQSVTNTIASAYALSQSDFAPITVGNTGSGNNVVVFELGRLTDSFTNGVVVGSLTVSYAKNAY